MVALSMQRTLVMAITVCVALYLVKFASQQPRNKKASPANALRLQLLKQDAARNEASLDKEINKLKAEIVTLQDDLKKEAALPAPSARIVAPAPAPAGPTGKVGFFVVCVNNKDHLGHDGMLQIYRAVALSCSLNKVGSKLKRYALLYGYDQKAKALLVGADFKIIDVSDVDMKPAYKPIYSSEESIKKKRRTSPDKVQKREDGWATYYKFLLWQQTEFDKLLFSDTDVVILENPDSWLETGKYDEFLCDIEVAKRNYDGLNTHMMLITPSKDIYELLVLKATQGSYVAYTNTEQDVIETVLEVDFHRVKKREKDGYGKVDLPKHAHQSRHATYPTTYWQRNANRKDCHGYALPTEKEMT